MMKDIVIHLMWLGFMVGILCIVWALERIEKAIRAIPWK